MRVIILILLFCGNTNTCFSQLQDKEAKLDSIFTMLYKQNQFNGSVLIADKGEVIFKKGYGFCNEQIKRLNNTNTVFELASCSKQFTAAAIVLLKRQGKLKYEDKISSFFPELAFWSKVTIYDLLRHTSGIPEYLSDMRGSWDKTKIATNKDVIEFYANRKDTLSFEPGSKYDYCNTNYVLLASIIERTSGQDYASFLKENIFRPLRMHNTFVYNRRKSPKKIKNYATGYVWAPNSFDKVTKECKDSSVYYFDGVVGEAKVNSTVEDVYKWIVALKNNTLFTQAEFESMTEITKTSDGKNIPYGFGLDVSKGENKFSFGHTGHWDGYITFIYHNVVKDRTIIILQNFEMGTYLYNNIKQILDTQTLTNECKKRISLSESEIQIYTGVYTDKENPEEQHIITYLNGHLLYNTAKIKWDMRFFPVSTNEFQAIRLGGTDGVIRFSQSENGNTILEMSEYGKIIGVGIRTK